MFYRSLKLKKGIAIVLLAGFVLPYEVFVFPKSAVAWTSTTVAGGYLTVTVLDTIPTDAKEGYFGFGLDTVGWLVSKVALAAMTDSIVKWINSGFKGDPTFISNPEAFFRDVANEATGAFMRDTALAPFCDAFKPQILIALAQTQTYRQRAKCTLLDVVGNVEGFFNDFSQGGWAGWITFTQQPQNNPFGAYLIALDERSNRVAEALANAKADANQGQGFISLKKCSLWSNDEIGPPNAGENGDLGPVDDLGFPVNETQDSFDGTEGVFSTGTSNGRTCLRYDTQTPGKVIADSLAKALGAPADSLVASDEIGESLTAIFNALINQLALQGLRSLSGSKKGVGGTWYEQDIAKDQDALIKEIDKTIKKESARIGVSDKAREGIQLAEDTRACYNEQIAIIKDPLFNPTNGYSIPTEKEIGEKIINVDVREAAAKELLSDPKVAAGLARIDELNALRESVLLADSPAALSEGWVAFNEFKLKNAKEESDNSRTVQSVDTSYEDGLKEYEMCQAKNEELGAHVHEPVPIDVNCVGGCEALQGGGQSQQQTTTQ